MKTIKLLTFMLIVVLANSSNLSTPTIKGFAPNTEQLTQTIAQLISSFTAIVEPTAVDGIYSCVKELIETSLRIYEAYDNYKKGGDRDQLIKDLLVVYDEAKKAIVECKDLVV